MSIAWDRLIRMMNTSLLNASPPQNTFQTSKVSVTVFLVVSIMNQNRIKTTRTRYR